MWAQLRSWNRITAETSGCHVRARREGRRLAGLEGPYWRPDPPLHPTVGTSPQAVSVSEIGQKGSPQGLGTDPQGRGRAAS